MLKVLFRVTKVAYPHRAFLTVYLARNDMRSTLGAEDLTCKVSK
jgi:hypothetical protein